MYAVIRVGTSQERVTEGQVVRVDLRHEAIDAEIKRTREAFAALALVGGVLFLTVTHAVVAP